MRPLSEKLLTQAKDRAIAQIEYAIKKLRRYGHIGTPYSWIDEENKAQMSHVFTQRGYAFILLPLGGVPDTPCYYDFNKRTWLHAYNLPADDLIRCADGLLIDAIQAGY
ncbi:MAG: hypothetical protein LIO91_03690 [Bacteroidales bacterium]|nr:hypothetical protein [Bacteroidales bacterium]